MLIVICLEDPDFRLEGKSASQFVPVATAFKHAVECKLLQSIQEIMMRQPLEKMGQIWQELALEVFSECNYPDMCDSSDSEVSVEETERKMESSREN